MKNPLILIAIVTVVGGLAVGAFTFFQNSSQPDSMMKKDEAMMLKEETSMPPKDAMMPKDDSAMEGEKMMDDKMTDTQYVQYSKVAYDAASGNRRVLFFYASWCPTCQPADASFLQSQDRIPEDVTVIRVNYNDPETDQEEKDLAKKYGITYQHTYVQIDGTGREVKKWNGGKIDELLTNLQ